MSYIVTCIVASGDTFTSSHTKSPNTEWLLERWREHNAQFAVRYWPSKRGWRILDMRNIVERLRFSAPGNSRYWHKYAGAEWSERVYPNEDSAVMHATMLLATALT